MYIRHKIDRTSWDGLYVHCKKVAEIADKYNIPLKFDWDGDDVPITIYVKPNSDPDDLVYQYLKDYKYQQKSALSKFLYKGIK